MFDNLATYLDLVVLPERKANTLRTCELLAKVGCMTLQDDLENLLSMGELLDNQTLLDDIQGLLEGAVEAKLGEFGVTLNSGDLNFKALLLETLVVLGDFEMFETIAVVCESDDSNEEKLAALAELVGLLEWGSVMENVNSVTTNLIQRFYELAGNALEAKEKTVETISLEPIRKRLSSFLTRHPNTMVGEAVIENGFKLGMPLEVVVEAFDDFIAPLAPSKAVEEITAAVLCSNVPDADVQKAVSKTVEDIFHDIDYLSTANAEVLKIMKDIAYAQA